MSGLWRPLVLTDPSHQAFATLKSVPSRAISLHFTNGKLKPSVTAKQHAEPAQSFTKSSFLKVTGMLHGEPAQNVHTHGVTENTESAQVFRKQKHYSRGGVRPLLRCPWQLHSPDLGGALKLQKLEHKCKKFTLGNKPKSSCISHRKFCERAFSNKTYDRSQAAFDMTSGLETLQHLPLDVCSFRILTRVDFSRNSACCTLQD